MLTNEQLEKIPKCAKEEILSLRAKVESLREELKSYGDKNPTRIRWGYDNEAISDTYGYIRDIETVFFRLRDKRGMVRVRLVHGGESLNINGDGSLTIEPYSTNDVVIKLRD